MHPSKTYSDGPEILLTCGSTDGFSKFLQTFNNEWIDGRDNVKEREGLLVEEFAYMVMSLQTGSRPTRSLY